MPRPVALPSPWPQDGIRVCVKRAADTFLASASGFLSQRERERESIVCVCSEHVEMECLTKSRAKRRSFCDLWAKLEQKSMSSHGVYRKEEEECVRFKESNKQWTQEKIKWPALDLMPGHGIIFLQKSSLYKPSPRKGQERFVGRVWDHWRVRSCQVGVFILLEDSQEWVTMNSFASTIPLGYSRILGVL